LDHDYPLLSGNEGESTSQTTTIAKRENLIILIIVCINTLATCFLIILNKYIFSFPKLHSLQLSFTAWHVFCTFCILFIASHGPFQLFDRVYMDIRKVLPLSLAFTAWIVLNNLSLALNPLGFYQIAKILTTPTVVLLNYFMTGTRVSKTVLGALGVICVGAALTCQSSTEKTPLGVLVAVVAFVMTALYQIWIGTKRAGLDSAQLLFNQSYVSLGLLMVLVPCIDGRKLVEATKPSGEQLEARVWVAIVLSGATAMVVNLTQFLIIGRTSAVTVCIQSKNWNWRLLTQTV
jgi:solute carrier family 35 protein E3